MTLGVFMPLIVALGDWTFAAFVWRKLNALPTHTNPGFDERTTAGELLNLKLILVVLLISPALIYIALNIILPDVGTTVLF